MINKFWEICKYICIYNLDSFPFPCFLGSWQAGILVLSPCLPTAHWSLTLLVLYFTPCPSPHSLSTALIFLLAFTPLLIHGEIRTDQRKLFMILRTLSSNFRNHWFFVFFFPTYTESSAMTLLPALSYAIFQHQFPGNKNQLFSRPLFLSTNCFMFTFSPRSITFPLSHS